MSRLQDIGDQDGWRCWVCDQPVDPDMADSDPRGPSLDTMHPREKGPRKVAGPERLAHRDCNTKKGQITPEIAWPSELFVVDPAVLLTVADRLRRKGGREIVARCPTQDDGQDAADWVTSRLSRLVPDLPVVATVESGGSQFMVAVTAPR